MVGLLTVSLAGPGKDLRKSGYMDLSNVVTPPQMGGLLSP